MTRFGRWKIPKCLENGPVWRQKWVKKGAITGLSKSGPAPLGVHKQMKLAPIEPVLTKFSPFHHMYAPSCTLHTYLGAVWWSHLELGRGVQIRGYIHIYIYVCVCVCVCVWQVSGGTFCTHGSGSRGTSRRGCGPLGLCDRAQTPSRCAPGIPLGLNRHKPTFPGATNGAAGFARQPAAGVAVRGILRNGAPAVGQPTAVATKARPRDVRGAGPGLRGPHGAGTPAPQRPPAAGGHIATTHHRPSAENGPRCVAAASAGRGPSKGQGGVDGQIPTAVEGLRVCGEGSATIVRAPGRPLVPNAPARGALPSAMDAAPGAAGSGAAGCVPIGLLAPGRTGAVAPAALSALAAPAGEARSARSKRRGRGPHGTAAAGGPVCATPGLALCRLRAAGRRALPLAGSRRSPHGRGASAAGVAEACAAGAGRLCGGIPGRAGLAKRAQTPLLAIALTSARDAMSAPARALVRAAPGGALNPPQCVSKGGGGHSLSGSAMLNQRGGLPFPPSPLPPRGTARQGGAHGERRQASLAPAGRPERHTRMEGGGGYNRVHTPPPSQGLAKILEDISRWLIAARARSSATGGGGAVRGRRRRPP